MQDAESRVVVASDSYDQIFGHDPTIDKNKAAVLRHHARRHIAFEIQESLKHLWPRTLVAPPKSTIFLCPALIACGFDRIPRQTERTFIERKAALAFDGFKIEQPSVAESYL